MAARTGWRTLYAPNAQPTQEQADNSLTRTPPAVVEPAKATPKATLIQAEAEAKAREFVTDRQWWC